MPQKQVTIQDIARKLNLSKSTVSRALRDCWDINAATRQRVLKAAREMNYKPNKIALSLRQNKSFNIGIIIPSFTIPFYAKAISGIQETLMQAGYNIMVCQSNESYQTEVDNLNALMQSQVDGIIISLSRQTTDYRHITGLNETGTPIVMFNRVIENLNIAKVLVDDYQGTCEVVEHLIKSGARKIAHIAGPEGILLADKRRRAFIDTLQKYKVAVRKEWIVSGDFSIESGMQCMKKIFSTGKMPDAVFAVCDAMAFGAMKVIKEKKLNIPEHIALAGFTNETMASLVEPQLTTVAQPIYEIGKTAAELLIKQINSSPDSFLPEKKVLKTRLIIRGSSLKR